MTAIDRHPPNFPVHYPPIPKALPEVPTETGETIKETELEEIADVEVGENEILSYFEFFLETYSPIRSLYSSLILSETSVW